MLYAKIMLDYAHYAHPENLNVRLVLEIGLEHGMFIPSKQKTSGGGLHSAAWASAITLNSISFVRSLRSIAFHCVHCVHCVLLCYRQHQ